MKIAVIGSGYVGLVTGVCFADVGNDVWCVDVDITKINNLKQGRMPIYEPGLENILKHNFDSGRLRFTTDIQEALKHVNICFIAVGTPMGEDGSADLQYVLEVAQNIGKYMERHIYVVDKSTVPVGTAALVKGEIQKELDNREKKLSFDVISNPEFLKEGSAITDCSRPDRIVIGTDNSDAKEIMRELYLPYVRNTENLIFMDISSAEMTKYAANAMLATKISFMNEIANICEKVGADVNKVRMGIGSDPRIGYQFIYAGCGYGGSCFPKDVKALIRTSRQFGHEPELLKSVENVNDMQKMVVSGKVIKKFGEDLKGRTFAVWGLAFKPETDDMRESAAITIINELVNRGASIKAYDPKAKDEAKNCYLKHLEEIVYMESKYDTLDDADAMILITEWKEFRCPDFDEMKKRLKQAIIFDGRNQYDKKNMQHMGFEYYQIGVREE